jgi:hypothetical protein
MPSGMVTAYDLTVGTKINMDNAIYMVSPMDTPMLNGIGGDGMLLISSEPVDQIAFSWMHDSILTPRSHVGGAITTTQAFVTVPSGDLNKWSTGDVFVFQGVGTSPEWARVTGYGSTTDSLTLTRGWQGTTAAQTAGTLMVGNGTALAEGSVPENARTVDRSTATNYTQIFGPTKMDMSATEQQLDKYGVGRGEWAHQMRRVMTENAIAREQAYIYGAAVNSTTAKIRTTGGLKSFITSNRVTSTTLDVTSLTIAQLAGYNAGGFADVVMANPVAFATLNAAADTSIVRQTLDDPKRGRTRVAFVETEFGSVLMVRNRWMLPHDAVGFNKGQVRRRVLRPMVFERLAKVGDSDQAQVVCEEGLQVKGQAHLFKFDSLNYTGSN